MALGKRLVVFGRLDREGPELDTLLRERGFQVYGTEAEEELVDALEFSQPDVVAVLGQPNMQALSRFVSVAQSTGSSLIAVIWPGIPVQTAVSLLEMGVDYVASSYQPDWLAAQLHAYLRRVGRERSAPTVIELGHLRIDLHQRQVTVNGREVALTPTEFAVLRVLAERPGTVLPSGEIMQQVMGIRIAEGEAQDLLKVHVHRLRQKLESDSNNPRFIRTVRGHGYMYAFERRARERTETAPLKVTGGDSDRAESGERA